LCFQPFQLFILEKLETEAVSFEDVGQVLKDCLDNQNNTSDNEKVRGLEEGGPGRKMMCLSLPPVEVVDARKIRIEICEERKEDTTHFFSMENPCDSHHRKQRPNVWRRFW
jgi:hypothetical protein